MPHPLNDAALDQLFRTARTYNAFSGQVSDETLHRLYDLLKFGPTQANTTPARFVFVKSAEAKAKLGPTLDKGNYNKTMAAPVTVIVARDLDFHEKLPYLFPHTDAKAWFEGPRENRVKPALRNASLQAAYLIVAALMMVATSMVPRPRLCLGNTSATSVMPAPRSPASPMPAMQRYRA